jgi:galactokinase
MVLVNTQTPPPIRIACPEAERIERLVNRLRRDYPDVDPATIRVVRAPLRICPLGAHIDHQLGLVTGMTIDQAILLAFAPTTDGQVRVSSMNFEPPVSFSLANVPPYRRGDWGNYVRGAVLALQPDYQLDTGLAGVIEGEMPIGGLSSSAATTIAYLLALETINGLQLSPQTNVALVRFTENQYIGLNNGILDQSVILFSQFNHLTRIDCRTMQIDNVSTPPNAAEFDVLIVYSGVTRVLVGTDYNNRVAECQDAAGRLLSMTGQRVEGAPRLGLVSPEIFEAEGHRLPEPVQKRARHYFGEMRRVQEGIGAWQAGDLQRFGALMNESGESSIKFYECGSPQLITLYETLRQTPGVYGARFSGAGFRGNCIALIEPGARESVAEAIHRRYPAAHPAEAELYSIHFCRTDGQAHLTSWSH